MKDYRNKFDIAEGLVVTPEATLKDLRRNEAFRKNRRLLSLIKMMLDGFRKWMRIAVISGIKGLNPFSSNKNAVEKGYYDFRNTEEFKQLRNLLAGELGISKAYFRDDIREKYTVIRDMMVAQGEEEQLSNLELTSEGFFLDAEDNRCFDVLMPEQVESLRKFAEEHTKYEVKVEDVILHTNTSGVAVVDVDNALARAFLEKEYLGRDKERRPDSDSEPSKEETKTQTSEKEYIEFTKEGKVLRLELKTEGDWKYYERMSEQNEWASILHEYIGKDESLTIPEIIGGLPVHHVSHNALKGTTVKEVTVNNANVAPSALKIGEDVYPVMQGLDEKQQKAYDNFKSASKVISPTKEITERSFTPEQVEELRKFATDHPEHDISVDDVIKSEYNLPKDMREEDDPHKMVVVDANNALVRAFLEEESLGRDKGQKNQETLETTSPEVETVNITEDGIVPIKEDDFSEVTPHSDYRITINEDSRTVTLDKYVGRESYIKLPKAISIGDCVYPVSGVAKDVFANSKAAVVEVDASYWTAERINPVVFQYGGQTLEVNWLNLTAEQQQILKNNEMWAAETAKQEYINTDVPRNIPQAIYEKYGDNVPNQVAINIADQYLFIQLSEDGYEYSFADKNFRRGDKGLYDDLSCSITVALMEIADGEGLAGQPYVVDYDGLMEKIKETEHDHLAPDNVNQERQERENQTKPQKSKPKLKLFGMDR